MIAPKWLIGAVAGIAIAACSSGSDSSSNPPDLTGTWHATKYEFVSVAHPASKIDVITQGYSAVFVGSANHTWSVVVSSGAQVIDTQSGTYSETATTVTFTTTNKTPNSSITFNMSLNGSTLSLTGGSGSDNTFDFGNGEEAATLNLILVKQ